MTPLELADACEKATGPDYGLELDIYKACRPELYQRALDALLKSPIGPRLAPVDYDGYIKPPAYTASLDAAMTLVPEGWEWTINTFANPKKASAYLVNAADDMVRPRKQYQATPALALCAAALRAGRQG